MALAVVLLLSRIGQTGQTNVPFSCPSRGGGAVPPNHVGDVERARRARQEVRGNNLCHLRGV